MVDWRVPTSLVLGLLGVFMIVPRIRLWLVENRIFLKDKLEELEDEEEKYNEKI